MNVSARKERPVDGSGDHRDGRDHAGVGVLVKADLALAWASDVGSPHEPPWLVPIPHRNDEEAPLRQK
jgi:hypothetical protein